MVFDYLDGGAEGEVTLRENCHAFESVLFRPRQAVAFAQIDLHTQVLGTDLSLPFMLAPFGYCWLMHPGGEVVAARAAGEAGTGYILSTISGHKLENVVARPTGWHGISSIRWAEGKRQRARLSAHAKQDSALVITVDTTVAGVRPRNGMKELLLGEHIFENPLPAADSSGRRRICQLCQGVGPRKRCYIRGRPRLRNDLRPIWWRRKSPCAYGDAGS